jgi:hypothetical protein
MFPKLFHEIGRQGSLLSFYKVSITLQEKLIRKQERKGQKKGRRLTRVCIYWSPVPTALASCHLSIFKSNSHVSRGELTLCKEKKLCLITIL